MKKFFSLICIFTLIISCSGCSKSDNSKEYVERSSVVIYTTLEDSIYQATDIVKATCTDVTLNSDHTEYEFDVLERYVGEDTNQPIHLKIHNQYISVLDTEMSFDTDDFMYKVDEAYYLIMERNVSVYRDYDTYLDFGPRIYIPAYNVSESTMYGEPLTDHSNIEKCETEQDIIDHIVDQLKNNPNENRKLFFGRKYITSKDTETIIKQSEYVLKVRLDEIIPVNTDRDPFICTVTETLKGEYEEGTRIDIPFFKGKMKVGDECIVALLYVDKGVYVLSSRNSVFPLRKENKILKYIS